MFSKDVTRLVPVAGERAEDAHYFKSVADYIHLNPARGGLTGGGRKAYVAWLEARAENEGGKIDAKAMEAIRGCGACPWRERGRADHPDYRGRAGLRRTPKIGPVAKL